MWSKDQSLSLRAQPGGSPTQNMGQSPIKMGEGPMWAPPPTIVSGELEDEGPFASQSGRGMQISKRGSALRRPQSTVLRRFSKFSSLWLTPSEAWTLVRGWALGQGRTPGCPMSGRGEGQKWSETGPRPRRLWTQMMRRRPEDSEQRKGQTREGHRL